jgi:hypothetical protein
VFQTFDFTGFGEVIAVSWDQPFNATTHQFADIKLDTNPSAAVPEPASFTLSSAVLVGLVACAWRRSK